jgi:hypothetical protein
MLTIPVKDYDGNFGGPAQWFVKNLLKNKGSRLSLLFSENVSANN